MAGTDEQSFKMLMLEEDECEQRVVQTKLWKVRHPLEKEHHCKYEDHGYYKSRGLLCPHCETVVHAVVMSKEEINGRIER